MSGSDLPLPILPLSAPAISGVDPMAVVAALVGSPSVTLSGFHIKAAKKGLFLHPSVPFVDALHFEDVHDSFTLRKRIWERLVFAGGCLIVFSAALSLGILGSQYTTQFFQVKALEKVDASPIWSIVDVNSSGVLITINHSKTVLVAVGSVLPNNDLVLSVAPNERTIFLASSTVVLPPLMATEPPVMKDSND